MTTRCLLIDRNAAESERVMGLLADTGIEFVQLATPAEGLIHCRKHHPDVVLMEAGNLPQARDFLRHTRKLWENFGRPVVILYSADADVELMGESILEGASEFLMQPFDRELLLFKLQQAGVMAARAA